MTPGSAVNGLGKPVEPDVRLSSTSSGSSGSGDRRRFICTRCEDASKLVVLDEGFERGHEVDIRIVCAECETATRHEPDHGRSLAYYRWRGALRRRRAGR